jgi:adenylosuccinate lyase
MIPRYSYPEMAKRFTDEHRMSTWLEIELAALDGWVKAGVISPDIAREARERMPLVDSEFVARVNEREAVTDHDVAAFVDIVQQDIGGQAGSWVHYGLTSSDVVDTALASVLADASNLMLDAITELIEALRELAIAHRDTPCVGRTHGVHAEPTTFGAKVAIWCLQIDRDRQRMLHAMNNIAVGKLSGAVGTYSNIDPIVEQYVCQSMALRPVPSTQVLARDRHAELVYACTSLGTGIEQIALEIRHLQRTEVREAFEPFRAGQKGSSAMPHKRNPILCERLCGLARILRGNLTATLENVALWHERDISHSSVERMILPDTLGLAYYMTLKATGLVSKLDVRPDRMITNLESSFGLVFSQPVLLSLVAAGLTRDEAYKIVQRNAMRSWDEQQSFRALLDADPDVAGRVPASSLDEAFDLKRSLRHAAAAVDSLATTVDSPDQFNVRRPSVNRTRP